MGHRHLSNLSAQMFGTDQDHYRSHVTAQQSHIHLGRTVAPGNVSLFYPMENTLMSRAVCTSQRGLEFRPVAHSISTVRLEIPHRGAVLGPGFEPLPHFPAVGSFYQAPSGNSGHAHTSNYGNHSIHEVVGFVDPTAGTRRGRFKRKSPSICAASERGISTIYGAGSSSSSSQLQLEKSTTGYQTSEDSGRNVRSRSRLDLEPTPRGTYVPNYSHHYSPTTHLTNQSGAVNVANSSAVRTTHEQNHAMLFPAAYNRIPNSENNSLSQEMNWFPRGSTAENGGHCHGSIPRRDLVLPPQWQNVSARVAWSMNSSYSRRVIPSHRAGLNFSSLGRETVPSEYCPPYRYTRLPSARDWHNSHRNERPRMDIQRPVSLSNAVYTRDRLGSQAFTTLNHAPLYRSRNLFDGYGDMSIDVDNMGYEELLALGERIGNVSTGLSGDTISKCLETTCSSLDHNREESCAICLEEYKNEEVGTVKNCGHSYHVSCIKKWLLMKNACPICKAPALSDSLKEQ